MVSVPRMILWSMSPTAERMGHDLCPSTCKTKLFKIGKIKIISATSKMLSLTWPWPLYNNGNFFFYITLLEKNLSRSLCHPNFYNEFFSPNVLIFNFFYH